MQGRPAPGCGSSRRTRRRRSPTPHAQIGRLDRERRAFLAGAQRSRGPVGLVGAALRQVPRHQRRQQRRQQQSGAALAGQQHQRAPHRPSNSDGRTAAPQSSNQVRPGPARKASICRPWPCGALCNACRQDRSALLLRVWNPPDICQVSRHAGGGSWLPYWRYPDRSVSSAFPASARLEGMQRAEAGALFSWFPSLPGCSASRAFRAPPPAWRRSCSSLPWPSSSPASPSRCSLAASFCDLKARTRPP